ncbi:M3 family metallopeptidase [Micrococcus sp. EYE_162]|uniref:M3 family metallopeptidase n=1 Tax=unclassified Micrococcus TaxID=2620948 RepID=UPI00200341CC|nr:MULTISPECIES: M3 family metallopeptidase [unclassified Micrococcus]MCK6094915.1 M3 family metallopeptidase [Micrococcus sp. EYE_212]MCK6170862.1 M3 family metallopeptidase [Micrococcus sp. EYE_162]
MTSLTDTLPEGHPLLSPSALPHELPDFAACSDADLAAGIRQGMAEQRAEVEAILSSPDAPTFENTVRALELSGDLLRRVAAVFFTLVGADGTDARQALAQELSPELAAHEDALLLDPRLAERVAAIDAGSLTGEDARLLEVLRQRLDVAGAHLGGAEREELQRINGELASTSSAFTRRLVADTAARAVLVTDRERLAGLGQDDVDAAAAAAVEAGHRAADAPAGEGPWLLTLSLFTSQPWLADLEDEALRREVFEASVGRGASGENETLTLAMEIVRLRLRKARLLGASCWAEQALKDRSAPSVAAVEELLSAMAPRAMANARRDAAVVAGTGDGAAEVAPWNWPHLSARHAREAFAVDTAALRPYFELDRVLTQGVFAAAGALYGLTFTERPELARHLYRPGMRVWEVAREGGESVGLFVGDFFARATKSGGAWMHTVRDKSEALGEKPVVFTTMNVPAPAEGRPALLTLDETTTLFHEFGHALHGLLAEGEYPSVTGTAVPRDVVEFPSQVNEMWIREPQILAAYARHEETGEELPAGTLEKLEAADLWGEGYRTVEYLGATLIDWAWHTLTEETVDAATADPAAFERRVLTEAGIDPDLVPPRYGTGYFKHIFGSGYAAGYYSYVWAEVLDADTVEWFRENGGLTRENGDRFAAELLARGNTRDLLESYRAFRGRDAELEPLLRRRGLTEG